MGRIARIENEIIFEGRRDNRAWFAPGIHDRTYDFRFYHAVSDDGMPWRSLATWCWDDGTEIERPRTPCSTCWSTEIRCTSCTRASAS